MGSSAVEILGLLAGETADVLERVEQVDDHLTLVGLHLAEKRGRKRAKVLEAIETRGLEVEVARRAAGLDEPPPEPEGEEQPNARELLRPTSTIEVEMAETLARMAFSRPQHPPLGDTLLGALRDLAAKLADDEPCQGDEWPFYPVPNDEDFVDEQTGREWELMRAPDLDVIANVLLDAGLPGIDDYADWRVEWLWKRHGGTSHGKPPLGKTRKTSGDLGFYSGTDYIITLSADHLRGYLTRLYEVAAVVYHEMRHVRTTEKGGPAVRPHDAELFWSEVSVFGPWKADLKPAADQLALL